MSGEQENVNSNTERIVRLETLVESQTSFLQRIESKLDVISERYITKEMFNEITGGLQKQISEIKEEKKTHKNILPLWIALIPSLILATIEIINLLHK